MQRLVLTQISIVKTAIIIIIINNCEVGKDYDDGSFIYYCNKGCLEATYCIAYNEDGGTDVAMEVDERITYDLSTILRCEESKGDGKLYQVLEDVASETLATSKGSSCSK